MKINQIIPFKGNDIPTFMKNGVVYVALRPIIEGMGLNWGAQRDKINEQKQKFSCTVIRTTGKDGKRYRMLCIPLEKLPGWLFTINPEKVSIAARSTVVTYQDECFNALFTYWFYGEAKNPRFSAEKIKASKTEDLLTNFAHTSIKLERLRAEVRQTTAIFKQHQDEFRHRGLSEDLQLKKEING